MLANLRTNFGALVDALPEGLTTYLTIWTVDLLRYLIPATLTYWALTRIWPQWATPRRLGPVPRDGQIRREFAYSMLTVLIFAANGFLIKLLADARLIVIYREADQFGYLYLAISLPLVVLLHDLYFYAAHRLLHRPWWFARVHRWHHRSVHPTPWAAYAFHPVEAAVMAFFLPLLLLFIPLHGAVIALFLVVMIARNVIGHCGVELATNGVLGQLYGRIFATTVHHHQHHQHGRGNFGLYFRYLDQLFGTERPDYQEAIDWFTSRAPRSPIQFNVVATVALVAVLFSQPLPSEAANASITDQWWTPGFSSRVEIAPCNQGLCGRIVWLWDPRGDASVGQRVLWGFSQPLQAGWLAGSAFNPEDGQTYKARIKLLNPTRLLVSGCVLIFCKEQVWLRVDAMEIVPAAAGK